MRTRPLSTSQQRTFSVQSFLPGTSLQRERRKETLQISVKQVSIMSGQCSSDRVRVFCDLVVRGLTTGWFRPGVSPTFTAPYKPTRSPLVRLCGYPPENHAYDHTDASVSLTISVQCCRSSLAGLDSERPDDPTHSRRTCCGRNMYCH